MVLCITTASFADRPIVEQEQTFIHTSGTDRMEVVCTVHASPKAKVGDKKLSTLVRVFAAFPGILDLSKILSSQRSWRRYKRGCGGRV